MSEGVGASRPRNDEYRSETVQDDPSGCADDKQADFVDFSRYLAHIISLAGSSAVYLLVFMCMKTRSRGRSPPILSCAKNCLCKQACNTIFSPAQCTANWVHLNFHDDRKDHRVSLDSFP